MFHGRNDLGQRVVDSVDLAIDFATLGEYGLEIRAEGSARRRTDRHPRPDRRPGWEAPVRAPRSACGTRTDTVVTSGDRHSEWRFPGSRPSRANFRAALE